MHAIRFAQRFAVKTGWCACGTTPRHRQNRHVKTRCTPSGSFYATLREPFACIGHYASNLKACIRHYALTPTEPSRRANRMARMHVTWIRDVHACHACLCMRAYACVPMIHSCRR